MRENNIIIFDGLCNLCNWSVQFVIKRDSNAIFKFTSLQSEFGIAILKKHRLLFENPESVLLLKNGELLGKSSAALAIATNLKGSWKLLAIFRFVPKNIRDAIYDLIANNRYRWFGKRNRCMVPADELRKRFI